MQDKEHFPNAPSKEKFLILNGGEWNQSQSNVAVLNHPVPNALPSALVQQDLGGGERYVVFQYHYSMT